MGDVPAGKLLVQQGCHHCWSLEVVQLCSLVVGKPSEEELQKPGHSEETLLPPKMHILEEEA